MSGWPSLPISIVETFLKLLVVWVLAITSGDKLVVYSVLLLLVVIIIDIAYWYYCHRFLVANKFYLKTNKKTFCGINEFFLSGIYFMDWQMWAISNELI